MQIVEKVLNDYMRYRIVPAVITVIPGLQIVPQYVCIKLHDVIPMPGFLLFPTYFLDCTLVNILVFTMASWVNSASEGIIRKWRQRAGMKRKSVLRKQMLACCPLKIRFGINNIDRGTPLNIQNFCMDQTVQLLLIR